MMASLEPKLFCGVAFWTKGRLTLQARTRGSNWLVSRSRRVQFTPQYLSNDCLIQPGNASTPTEPIRRCTVHFRL